MKPTAFRAELVKLMPGYNWTVHKTSNEEFRLFATGTQSSGSNRLSTVQVDRYAIPSCNGVIAVTYKVKSAGYGRRAPWLHETVDGTLARAFRSLQQHYERQAQIYGSHASDLQVGRKAEGGAA